MNIDQAYEFCQFIANKDRNGIIKPSEFNTFAPVAQDDAINKRLAGLDKDQANRDELMPILVTAEKDTAADGTFLLPADYLRYSAGFIIDKGTKQALAEIDLLTSSQFGKRELSRLKGPADLYPIAKMESGKVTIAPRKVFTLHFSYVCKYKAPNWDYNVVEGVARYNPSVVAGVTGNISQDFSLAQTAHNEICFRILQYMGINLSHDTLLQYGLTKEKLS